MPFKFNELDLEEVSLVDDPASPGARVSLVKRHNPTPLRKGSEPMGDKEKKRLQELMDKGMSEDEAKRYMEKEAAKMADDAQKRVSELEGQNAQLEANVAELTKALEAAGQVVKIADGKVAIEKRSDDDYVEIDGERVLKSAVPAPILKRLEAQSATIEKLAEQAETTELNKRAATEIPHIGGDEVTKRTLLKAVDAIADETAREGVLKALKAASVMVGKAFDELGSSTTEEPVEGSAMAELNKMAKDYAEKNGVTVEKALTEVVKTRKGAELFAKRHAN